MTDTVTITVNREVAERFVGPNREEYEGLSSRTDRHTSREEYTYLDDLGSLVGAFEKALEASPATAEYLARRAAEAQSEARQREGWEVYDGDLGPQIQAVQDQDLDDGVVLTGLDTDLQAVAIVLRGAIAQKPYAVSALEEIGYRPEVFGTLESALEAVEHALEPSTVNPSLEEALDASHLYSAGDEEPDHSMLKEDARNRTGR
jgi:hypothetical protein